MIPPLITLAQAVAKSEKQLELLMRGYYGVVFIVIIGVIGIMMLLAFAVLWRRSLKRQRILETQIKELRLAGGSTGDAWAASARRIAVPGGRRAHDPESQDDIDDDEDGEEDDPYNLFGGHDPLDEDDEDDDGGFDDDEDDFDDDDGARPGDRR